MFRRETQGAVDVISCGAPITREHIDELSTTVKSCLGHGAPMVVLDLAGAALVDSGGLETLLELQQLVERLGGAIKLAAAPRVIRDSLRATGVGERFEILLTVKSAIGSFSR